MMAAAGLNTVRTYSTPRRHARRRILDAGRHPLECAMERFTGRDSVLAIAVRLDPGHKIAFAPAAQVRHHARSTLRAYRRRQRTYGASERMVCGRHTYRFNRLGRSRWAGFIHGFPRLPPGLLRPVVYHGTVGSAPYQGVLRRPAESVIPISLALLPLMVPPLVLGLARLARRLLGAAVLAAAAAAAAVEAALLWHLVPQVVVQTSRGSR